MPEQYKFKYGEYGKEKEKLRSKTYYNCYGKEVMEENPPPALLVTWEEYFMTKSK